MLNDRPPVTRGRHIAAALAAAVAISTTLTASAGQAAPAQEGPGAGDDMETSHAVIEIDVDVAEADASAVGGTLEELQANVTFQLAQLDAAEAAVTTAETELAAAQAVVAETQAEIDVLVQQSDDVVVNSFVNSPQTDAVDAFAADSVGDATVKHAILGMQAEDDADVLAQLDEARDKLEEQQEAEETLETEAENRKADAEAALTDLEAATSQQAEFLALVNERLDQGLAEAAALEALDPAKAAELRALQDELAAQLQAIADTEAYEAALAALAEAERQRQEELAANPPDPVTLGPASGSLATVSCPEGGSITVDSSLADSLAAMLAAAAADGVILCGAGYRSSEAQIELRKAHCGTSYYAIYEMPASRCSPPTAPPGSSRHELGLAIDFTCNGGGVISSSSSECFQWLDANAAGYGLYNLPSEFWHWSDNGN